MSYPILPATLVTLLTFTWYLVKRFRRHSIAQLPGPLPHSWLAGSIPALERPEDLGEADFEWTEKYGHAVRMKGCFGEDILFLSDPKALQYILNKSGYNFPKTGELRTRLRLAASRGIVWAEGAQHARQRKIMNPGFSHSALKGFLPLFLDIGRKSSDLRKADILNQNKGSDSSVVDVSAWLTSTTLDIIGEAAFAYHFDSLDGMETELSKSYRNLFTDVNYMPSDLTIAFRRIIGYAPEWLAVLLSSLPVPDLQRMNNNLEVSRRVARTVVETEMKAYMGGKAGGRDIISILVKANASEDPKRRLDEDEILSQIVTLMLAGHETTANTITWTLFELSKNTEAQSKLRDEIRAMRAQAIARGDRNVTIADLDSMKYMAAVVKETLRYHPIVPHIFRRAARDDVIPLTVPQRTVSGDVITAIPISEGQIVQISIAAYNRAKSVWGEDAGQWRPERFLDGSLPVQTETVGVLGNLATFSSGLRSCIGWRFSVIEIHALLVELVDSFEYSPAPASIEIKRASVALMQPMVKGQESKGVMMPLTVTVSKKSA